MASFVAFRRASAYAAYRSLWYLLSSGDRDMVVGAINGFPLHFFESPVPVVRDFAKIWTKIVLIWELKCFDGQSCYENNWVTRVLPCTLHTRTLLHDIHTCMVIY